MSSINLPGSVVYESLVPHNVERALSGDGITPFALIGSGTIDNSIQVFRLFLVLTTDVPVDLQFCAAVNDNQPPPIEVRALLSGRMRGLRNGTTITFDLSEKPWFETGFGGSPFINNNFSVISWHNSPNPVWIAGRAYVVTEQQWPVA
jgi:hypothetical protein